MSDEDCRALSQAELELKCGIFEIGLRSSRQENEDIKNFVFQFHRRITDPAASTVPDARALPAPAPVASGSGQLVQVPALPRRSAPGSTRDREPGVERSAHPRTRAYGGSATDRSTSTTHNTTRSSLIVTSRQNAANLNAPSRALAQAQVSAPPQAIGNRFHNRVARNLLLREAGAHPSMAMTPEDCDLVTKTPDITTGSFTNLFGGTPFTERPQSREWGTLCINRDAQPYAPHSPGASGLVFLHPGDALVLEDTCENFLLFLNMNPKVPRGAERQIRYLGTYTKVPIVHATVEKEEWKCLPVEASGIFPFRPACQAVSDDSLQCHKKWIRRIHTSTRIGAREAHARISLRKRSQGAPPPSTDAIRKWLEQNPEKYSGLTRADITAAFHSGEEKIGFEVIKCVRYDHGVAAQLIEDDQENDLA